MDVMAIPPRISARVLIAIFVHLSSPKIVHAGVGFVRTHPLDLIQGKGLNEASNYLLVILLKELQLGLRIDLYRALVRSFPQRSQRWRITTSPRSKARLSGLTCRHLWRPRRQERDSFPVMH